MTDVEKIAFRAPALAKTIAITAAVVVGYMRFEHRMSGIEETMSRDIAARLSEQDRLSKSIDGLREEMRRVFVDSVLTRQAQAWIEMARALNKDKRGDIVWPDLPR